MKNMNGSYVSDILYSELNKYLKNKRIPSIVDISIGNDFGSLMYSKMKEKTINNKTAIKFKSIHFDNISKDELINYIINLNNDTSVDGIMIQLPLPDYLSVYKREILDSISKEYGKYFKLNKFEVWENEDNAKLMEQFANKMGDEISGVPYIVIGNRTFKGFGEKHKEAIKDAIKEQYKDSYDVYLENK